MSNRRPSHFIPDTKDGVVVVMLIYGAVGGIAIYSGWGMILPGTIAGLIISSLLTLIDLVITAALVALVRHYRYVRPYQREAAHHCPECDYEIGEDQMEQGCPECGWQCEPF